MANEAPTRRQLTLFLPPGPREWVERIREQIDPVQYAQIAAHVTLCRDDEISAWSSVRQRLASIGRFSLTMRFGHPEVLPDGCMLLRPAEGLDEFHALRRALLGGDARLYGPHLTLLHPRNAPGAVYDLNEIAAVVGGLAATFESVALIEKTSTGPWIVREEYGATG